MSETRVITALHVPGRKVCAVCGRVLDEHEDETGVLGWAHTIDVPDDHPAVPVDDTEVPVNDKCDFCFADSTEWVLPAATFQLPPVLLPILGTMSEEQDPRLRSMGDWGACDPCGRFILAGQWAKVLRRVQERWPFVHSGHPMPEHNYIGTYRLFCTLRKNITGPLVRIEQ